MHVHEPVTMKLTVIAAIVGVAVLQLVEANDHAGIPYSRCACTCCGTA